MNFDVQEEPSTPLYPMHIPTYPKTIVTTDVKAEATRAAPTLTVTVTGQRSTHSVKSPGNAITSAQT